MAEPDSKQAARRPVHRGGTSGHRRGRQPITRHPLFPAIVGLWFAALLGMGSFALSTSLLENLVLAGHIDSVFAVAAPPLGMTARLLLALALGLAGGIVGWVLAWRVANPKQTPAPNVFKVAETDLGAAPQWPGVADRPRRAEPAAPIAGRLPVLDPASLIAHDQIVAPLPAAGPTPAHEAIIENAAVEDVIAPVAIAPEPEAIAPEALVQEVIPAERSVPLLGRPAPTAAATAAQRIASADLADLSHVELIERLAIALQRRDELLGVEPVEPANETNPVLHFPDFADRRVARGPLPAERSRPVPQETEKALREALTQLQRMSGGA